MINKRSSPWNLTQNGSLSRDALLMYIYYFAPRYRENRKDLLLQHSLKLLGCWLAFPNLIEKSNDYLYLTSPETTEYIIAVSPSPHSCMWGRRKKNRKFNYSRSRGMPIGSQYSSSLTILPYRIYVSVFLRFTGFHYRPTDSETIHWALIFIIRFVRPLKETKTWNEWGAFGQPLARILGPKELVIDFIRSVRTHYLIRSERSFMLKPHACFSQFSARHNKNNEETFPPKLSV
jgi:hypothetical protein